MAQITSEGAEPESQPKPDQNGTGGTAETCTEEQARPDPKQEPGDNNENRAGMDVNVGRGAPEEHGDSPARVPDADKEAASPTEKSDGDEGEPGGKLSEPGKSPFQGSLASSIDSAQEGSRVLKQEQRERENVSCSPSVDRTKTPSHGTKRRASVELTSSDGEPLSRMDSEDSISSTLMDMESTASSGRSTPAMLNGHNGGAVSGSGSAPPGGKSMGYTCCWDHCQMLFPSSPDLAEHIRATHVDGQRGGVFVCLWKGCKVYNTPSTSQSWLQRHMLTHSGDKPFKCVVGGCNATFASQGGLARHVPTHFSSQSSAKVSSQGKVKEESPSKAGLNKRRKLKNKHRRSLRKDTTHSLENYVYCSIHTNFLLFIFLLSVFQPDLMTSLTLRPWTPSVIEPSASTWQHTSRAWAMDTVWFSTVR
uniref:C2H2-type domain-containing protein n=1 Tax=Scophthalmus maximus TaxID=52904 RepID=A0A8D3BRP5_SCOMX